ncbi:hypothetical protein EHYA_09024 [Embleya hyalina]|uniref:Uncharacterized protein n=1 Tax=Embleya hyalina TaxID=516124 RepID=A0A401Z359_9ACTN|nr:hypothetical protein EHYA_09024 [Embleya hyalina]
MGRRDSIRRGLPGRPWPSYPSGMAWDGVTRFAEVRRAGLGRRVRVARHRTVRLDSRRSAGQALAVASGWRGIGRGDSIHGGRPGRPWPPRPGGAASDGATRFAEVGRTAWPPRPGGTASDCATRSAEVRRTGPGRRIRGIEDSAGRERATWCRRAGRRRVGCFGANASDGSVVIGSGRSSADARRSGLRADRSRRWWSPIRVRTMWPASACRTRCSRACPGARPGPARTGWVRMCRPATRPPGVCPDPITRRGSPLPITRPRRGPASPDLPRAASAPVADGLPIASAPGLARGQ